MSGEIDPFAAVGFAYNLSLSTPICNGILIPACHHLPPRLGPRRVRWADVHVAFPHAVYAVESEVEQETL